MQADDDFDPSHVTIPNMPPEPLSLLKQLVGHMRELVGQLREMCVAEKCAPGEPKPPRYSSSHQVRLRDVFVLSIKPPGL